MLKDSPRRALGLWLALLIVTVVAAAAMVVWMQPDILSTVSGPGP